MLSTRWFRVGVCLTVAVAGGSMITGCMGSPRYGTDKTAMEQLTDDLGQSVSLTGDGPKNKGSSTVRAPASFCRPRQPRKPLSSRSRASPARKIRSGSNLRRKRARVWLKKLTKTATTRATARRSQTIRSKVAGRRLKRRARPIAKPAPSRRAPISISAATSRTRRPSIVRSTIRQSSTI